MRQLYAKEWSLSRTYVRTYLLLLQKRMQDEISIRN